LYGFKPKVINNYTTMPKNNFDQLGYQSSITARLWRFLVGKPLPVSRAAHEQITAPEGLAAMSLDAITSVAYGPQAIVYELAIAGTAALVYLRDITFAIVILLVLLVTSYIQVIAAYPQGGGAYAVAKENLPWYLSWLAGASLIVDYVLTVSVSIAAGIAAISSAFPQLQPYTLYLCLAMLGMITLLNLRGVGESARAFLLPTMIFIGSVLLVIALGFVHPTYPHSLGLRPSFTGSIKMVSPLLLLKAFSAGCSALTGVEAIANGVPLFKEPRQSRARNTEIALGAILGVMLLGLAQLGTNFHVVPSNNQTVLSQIMQASVGRSWLYYLASLSTTIVLGLAANTSFGGLPVLLSLLAHDNLVPHIFSVRGDRLVFSYGVVVVAILSAALLIGANGNTNALIPLFAIGVFIGFTLCQTGLVIHWLKTKKGSWWLVRAFLNAAGAFATGVATLIFLFTKFTSGAWLVAVAIPTLIAMFMYINRYYRRVADALGLGKLPPLPHKSKVLVVVAATDISLLTVNALSYAFSLGSQVYAVTVRFNDEDASRIERLWEQWSPGVQLTVLRSQYHSLVRPIVHYIKTLESTHSPDTKILLLIPEISPKHIWQKLLHNHMGLIIASQVQKNTNALVARLPMPV
jgi:amino acid transporter